MIFEAFAPAKVNLFLHVGPREARGYHPVRSLMVFADVGDRLALAPSPSLEVRLEGEFAHGLTAGPENLVVQARDALLAAAPKPDHAFRLTLTKNLPLAAGLGGGTSDGAAALRLINGALELGLDDAVLGRLALGLGSDGPACLAARNVIAEGRGETLRPAPSMPVLDAVLVNPGFASPTAEVYAAFDRAGGGSGLDTPSLPAAFATALDLAAFLRACRNDLELAAIAMTPAIADVLADLRARQVLLARLSGSGATVFALCADAAGARRLAAQIAAARPGWWVRPCRLGGARA
jgi:4-diphosphocytidyl-2-C-methyl-D-erythritol kinase